MRLIDADAAIDALRKMQTYKLFAGDDMLLIDQAEAQTELMMLPPVQPERKTGKWIDETFKPWGLVYHPYKCDQCGEHSEADSNFCPSCGADMREEDDHD